MIQVFRPVLDANVIIPELRKAFKTGWIGLGPKVREFELAVAKYVCEDPKPDRFCCGMNSCTAALHLAVKSMNLPPKAKVATTPITFISTNHVLRYENLTPVFCDVEPRTGNISIESIEKAMKVHDIAAIMVVHLGGYPCDMERINALGVPVIEDCAHAFGARYENGKRVGSGKNLCCFSFHAVKNLPMGDGGMIVTSSKKQQEWFKKQRWLGIDKDTVSRSNEGYAWEYEVEFVGYKYHMNDIAAIIGLAQLERVRRENIFRRRVAAYYAANMPQWVRRPDYNGHRLSAHHFYPMFFSDRKAVYAKLLAAEIFPGMHYKMNTKYAPYQGYPRMELDGALEYEATELTLPLHLGLTQTDMKHIVEVISS